MDESNSGNDQGNTFSVTDARRALVERRDQLIRLRDDQEVERKGLEDQLPQDTGDSAVRDDGIDVLDHLDEDEREELRRIDAALMRIAADSYGICIECGYRIDPERLRAVPYTERCIECAEPKVTSDEFASREHHRNTL